MAEKRVNQFNLMLTAAELRMLKSKAQKRGFINKSQYLRELIRGDDPDRAEKTESGKGQGSDPGFRCLLKMVAALGIVNTLMLILLLILAMARP